MASGNGVVAYWILSSLLLLYMLGAGIELGAGACTALVRLRPQPGLAEAVRQSVLGWMSPVWETTNVFLVGFVVAMVAFFPSSISYYGRWFLYPAVLGLVMLIVRGLLFTVLYQRRHEPLPWGQTLFALASLLVPVFWIGFFAVSLGAGQSRPLWSSSVYWTLAWLAIATSLQLGGTFLAWYGSRQPRAATNPSPRALARLAALSGGAALIGQIALLLVVRAALPRYGQALLAGGPFTGWVVGVGLLAVATTLLARTGWIGRIHRLPGAALLLLLAANLVLLTAYGAAHLPYLAEAATDASSLTVEQAVVNAATYRSLLWVLGVGAVVIVPALVLLYALFLPSRPGPRSRSHPRSRPAEAERLGTS